MKSSAGVVSIYFPKENFGPQNFLKKKKSYHSQIRLSAASNFKTLPSFWIIPKIMNLKLQTWESQLQVLLEARSLGTYGNIDFHGSY
jgi:hypothetical protein